MPGPSNKRKQKKTQAKKEKRRTSVPISAGEFVGVGEVTCSEEPLGREEGDFWEDTRTGVHGRPLPEPPTPTYYLDDPSGGTSHAFNTTPPAPSPSPSPSPPPSHIIPFDSWDLSHNHTPAPPYISSTHPDTISEKVSSAASPEPQDDIFLRLSNPIIHDPGNGPRVLSARDFIQSSFAQPPCVSDPLRAEFAQQEVLQMLCTVLPEETAIVRRFPCLRSYNLKFEGFGLTVTLQFVWYNKSRKVGRVCPACRRLYQLGDALANPFTDLDMQESPEKKEPSPYLAAEQEISGLCTCFFRSCLVHVPVN